MIDSWLARILELQEDTIRISAGSSPAMVDGHERYADSEFVATVVA